MPGYGEINHIWRDFSTFTWVIHDAISIRSIRSPTFEFMSLPFHIRMSAHSRDDRLQISIHTETTPRERFTVTFKMRTGMNEEYESRCGTLDMKGNFFVRRWMPWKEFLKRRLDIMEDGIVELTCKLKKEENTFCSTETTSTEDETAGKIRKSTENDEELWVGIEDRASADENDEDSDEVDEVTLLKNLKKLQKDLKNMLKSGEDCDVTLKVQNKEFPVHRNILRSRSPVFKAMFSHETQEKLSGVVVIDDLDPGSFPDFLNYLYSGSTHQISEANVCNVFTASDKYQVQELKEECTEFMKSHLSVETFCDIMILALQHKEQKLIDSATEFFCVNTVEIVKTAKWQMFLKENSTVGNELFLKSLLK